MKTPTKMTVVAAAATLGLSATAFAATKAHHSGKRHAGAAAASRLDDGKDLLPKAKITEQQAIAAAQKAATGDLNEVDLEYKDGTLVFNVDVGKKDVKVDASNGNVLAVDQDD